MTQERNTEQKALRLSIVVPVYNVKEYLPACMESLLGQAEGRPVEILLVDDGSTDGSGQLCQEYAKQHGQVRAFRQENGGASAARNLGIRQAEGAYIQFVDSDDWLEEGALEKILAALENQPDVLLVNLNRYRDGKKESVTGWHSESLAGGADAFLGRLIRKDPLYCVVVSPILSRDWQQKENLFFLEGIIHEDMEWIPHLLCRAGSIRVLDEPVYAYRLSRQGSVMNATSLEKHVVSLMMTARTLMGERQEYDKIRQKFCRRAAGLCLFMAMEYAFRQGENRAQKLEKEIWADLLLAPALRDLPRKYALCCLLGRGLTGGIRLYYR